MILYKCKVLTPKGFGTIAKLVMKDRRLKPLAKTIYSYLCSHAGAGKTTFPSRHTIIADLGISMDSYYTHLKQLKSLGYVKVIQERDKTGQFKRSIFTLADVLQTDDELCREKVHKGKRRTVKPDTYNKQKEINNSFNNNQSSSSICESETRQDIQTDWNTTVQEIKAYTKLLKANIDYDSFEISRPHSIKLIDEFINIIIDAIMTESRAVRIGGEDKPRALAKN